MRITKYFQKVLVFLLMCSILVAHYRVVYVCRSIYKSA